MATHGIQPALILRNGRIATLESSRSFVQALAVQDGRFLAVGSDEEIMRLRGAKTEVFDLGGRTVIPGLNDSHMHPIRGGLNYNMELRWDGVPSLADALRMLREQAQRTPPPQWVRAVGDFPGYVGREIFRPAHGSRKYTTIVRFNSHEHLNDWAESDVRRSYINRVSDVLAEGDQHEIRTGIDFWFTPGGMKSPKPWKQFLLTLSAVYPLTLILPRLLGPLFSFVPPPLNDELMQGFAVAASLTALLTFVIMPRYTRLVKSWLYEESE